MDQPQPLVADTFRAWREIMQNHFPGFDPRPIESGGFKATLSHQLVGDLDVTEMLADRCSVVHDRLDRAAASRPGCCLILQLSGSASISQAGSEIRLNPGDLTLVDGTRPVRFDFPTPYHHVAIRLGYGTVSRHLGGRVPTAQRLGGDGIIAEVIRGMIMPVVQRANALREEQSRQLVKTLIDLLGTVIGDIDSLPLDESCDSALYDDARLLVIKRYIERHLSDPDLDSQTIARANGLSERQLYRLFESAGSSPGQWLLAQRLKLCRRALQDQRLTSDSIGSIAMRYGFSSFSHFSRSYKNSFGVTPRDEQSRARTRKPREGSQ